MARRIHYFVCDDGMNTISDEEWEEIVKLQRWYNSEFFWSAGRLAFKMYSIFPEWEKNIEDRKFWENISRRRKELTNLKLSENQIILQMQKEGLIITKRGGYRDGCIASGFTKVGNNELNAYLVCEFLIKVSQIARNSFIDVFDEGRFIKTNYIKLKEGKLVGNQKKVFSIVNPSKYNNFQQYHTYVLNYSKLQPESKEKILHDWKWLGFDDNYDLNGDDIEGLNLNLKILDNS